MSETRGSPPPAEGFSRTDVALATLGAVNIALGGLSVFLAAPFGFAATVAALALPPAVGLTILDRPKGARRRPKSRESRYGGRGGNLAALSAAYWLIGGLLLAAPTVHPKVWPLGLLGGVFAAFGATLVSSMRRTDVILDGDSIVCIVAGRELWSVPWAFVTEVRVLHGVLFGPKGAPMPYRSLAVVDAAHHSFEIDGQRISRGGMERIEAAIQREARAHPSARWVGG